MISLLTLYQGTQNMDPKNYQNSSAGKPLKHPNGYWYFLPTNLPPDLNWSPMLISILADAERNLAKLVGLGISPINLNWVVQPFIRREAVVSTRIEGTRTSLSDLYTYEAQQLSFLSEIALILMGVFRNTRVSHVSTHQNFQECT